MSRIPNREKKKQKLYSISNICGICGNPVAYKNANLDHIIPVSLGGGSVISNLRITHFKCNERRGNACT